jgi:hypothetical protein
MSEILLTVRNTCIIVRAPSQRTGWSSGPAILRFLLSVSAAKSVRFSLHTQLGKNGNSLGGLSMTAQEVIIVVVLIAVQGAVVVIGWRMIWSRILHRLEEYAYFRPYDYPFYEPDLTFILERAQREAQVELTWGARQMLIIPVMETIQRQGRVDWNQIDESIKDIVRTIGEEERRPELPGRTRDSISVIRGFWKRFCNIPPFCSRTEERRG